MSGTGINYTFEGYDPDDGLTGGRWMFDDLRRCQVWVETPYPQGRVINVQAMRACPTCHAPMAATCVTKSGHKRTPHKTRLTFRYCPCGAVAPARAKFCQPCADERVRVSKRDSQRRARAGERAA